MRPRRARWIGFAALATLAVATVVVVHDAHLPTFWWAASGWGGGVALAAISGSVSREEREAALLAVAERSRDGKMYTKPPHVARASRLTTDRAAEVLSDMATDEWVRNGRVPGAYSLTDAGRARVLVCAHCGELRRVQPHELRGGRRYCDEACRREHQRENHTVELVCEACGDDYTKPRSRADDSRYCSEACHPYLGGPHEEAGACEWCREPTPPTPPSQPGRYCSPDCSADAGRAERFGHPEPVEQVRAVAEAADGPLTRDEIAERVPCVSVERALDHAIEAAGIEPVSPDLSDVAVEVLGVVAGLREGLGLSNVKLSNVQSRAALDGRRISWGLNELADEGFLERREEITSERVWRIVPEAVEEVGATPIEVSYPSTADEADEAADEEAGEAGGPEDDEPGGPPVPDPGPADPEPSPSPAEAPAPDGEDEAEEADERTCGCGFPKVPDGSGSMYCPRCSEQPAPVAEASD